MHVHAHPDDESSKGAASTAKYVAEGVDVHVVTCTGGERGSVLNPNFEHAGITDNPEMIASIRRDEMDKAREILGVTQDWLGFVDSGWPEGNPLPPLPPGCFALLSVEEAARPLVRLIRDFKPQVVTTYDETGGYPHPDHIMCHKITVEAFHAAGDPNRYPEEGEPWQPAKLYYHQGWSYPRAKAINEAMIAHGLEPIYQKRMAELKDAPVRFTTRVPCAEYFEVRDQALVAHATQIDPNGFWFAVPRQIQQEAWPTEDYELAISTVDTSLPEDDLFAGLR